MPISRSLLFIAFNAAPQMLKSFLFEDGKRFKKREKNILIHENFKEIFKKTDLTSIATFEGESLLSFFCQFLKILPCHHRLG